MPPAEYLGLAATPLVSLSRSFLSHRRLDGDHPFPDDDAELDAFQHRVAYLFADLAAGDDLLSIAWVRRLLKAFQICFADFSTVLSTHRSVDARTPADRLVADFFERAVKALDVCNEVSDGIEQMRQWEKHLEIVLSALGDQHKLPREGQLRRARKALTELALAMLDEKEAGTSLFTHHNRSFGRRHCPESGHSRSRSWSLSRSWSAAKQLQAIGNNLAIPRGHKTFAALVYTMNSILLFSMWALVAAIPCQDRGLNVHFSIHKGFLWATPMSMLHDRISEEARKMERKHSRGLLKEIDGMEKCSRRLMDLIDLPTAAEKVRREVEELAQVVEAVKQGLNPMERQVRDVFHCIVRFRADGLDSSAAHSTIFAK